MNKRGISSIVATVLILLLLVIAVSIVWSSTRAIITKNSQTKIQTSGIEILTSEGYTYYNQERKEACVQIIKRSENNDLNGIQINLESKGTTFFTAIINQSEIPEINTQKVFCFDLSNYSQIPDKVTLGDQEVDLIQGQIEGSEKCQSVPSYICENIEAIPENKNICTSYGCNYEEIHYPGCDINNSRCNETDINLDERLDAEDYSILIDLINNVNELNNCTYLQESYGSVNELDLDKNGEVSCSELTALINRADINKDGIINIPDADELNNLMNNNPFYEFAGVKIRCYPSECIAINKEGCEKLTGCNWKDSCKINSDCPDRDNCNYGICNNQQCSYTYNHTKIGCVSESGAPIECFKDSDCNNYLEYFNFTSDCSKKYCESNTCKINLFDGVGCSIKCGAINQSSCQINLKSTYPYNETTIIYPNLTSWYEYNHNGKIYQVSPLVSKSNEINNHKITVDFTSISGTGYVNAIIAYDAIDFSNSSLLKTDSKQLTSGQESLIIFPYSVSKSRLVLEIGGDAQVTKVNHTYWQGINTIWGYEPQIFNFSGSYIPYRIIYPKNYDSSSGKKYPVIFYFPGGGEVGKDNYRQVTATSSFANYYFRNFYQNPEFEAFSIIAQNPTTSNTSQTPVAYNEVPNEINHSYQSESLDRTKIEGIRDPNSFYILGMKEMAKELKKNPSIDPDRIYVTGFSFGAQNSFGIMKKDSQRIFAAFWIIGYPAIITPPLGLDDPNIKIIELKESIKDYKNYPILIHDGDSAGGLYEEGLICQEINAAGGTCIQVIEPGVTHDTAVSYSNITSMRWLFSQRRT